MAEKRKPTYDLEALKTITDNPICPETGDPIRRDVRPMTLTYKDESITFDQPGWYCDQADEGILVGKDLQMVGILAELERSLIQERTKAGRAAAVARGVWMGRKRFLSAQQVAHARKLIEQGEDPDDVAESL
ncbi:hypothetical protein SBDP1_90040 [Syntrophobacter sp. SbD1]|nr:hypothetical protein SBDP1_90040 [Syntrophobacter sp. SbD1]